MMAISTKLALLVFVLPLSVLIICDIVGFLIFGVLYIEVIAIFTSNWVFLLVWERLRESLDKKLEYLDSNIFLALYSELNVGNLFFKQEKIEKAKNELQKHGKFMIIALYPKNLLKKLNTFLQLHNSFYEKIGQLLKIAEKEFGREPDKWIIFRLLGFGEFGYSHPSQQEVIAYTTVTLAIKKKHSQLLNDAINIYAEVKEEQKRIFEEFEDFLKANNLRLTLQPVNPY
jgi:tRNA nucleotidyltransferase/poly(A) polymerase